MTDPARLRSLAAESRETAAGVYDEDARGRLLKAAAELERIADQFDPLKWAGFWPVGRRGSGSVVGDGADADTEDETEAPWGAEGEVRL